MYVLAMPTRSVTPSGYQRLTMSGGVGTPLGQVVLAGEVRDAEPVMPRRLRVLDSVVLSVVTQGSGTYRHADGRTEPIAPSSVTVVLPGEPHWYGTDRGRRWTEWFAVVNGPVFDLLISTGRLTRSGPRPLPATVRAADLALILRSAPPPSAAEHQVWAIAQWLSGALNPDADGATAMWDRAEALLTADLDAPLSLSAVADELGLGYDAFRRQFKDRFGQSPMAYRSERRLAVAATLLRLTTLTCREIARRLGYSDEFHLSRRFRRHYGLSPTAYRRSP